MEDVYYLNTHAPLTKEYPVIFRSLFKESNMANALKPDMKNHGVQYQMPYMDHHMEWFVTNVGKMKRIHGETVLLVEMMKIVSLNAQLILIFQQHAKM